MKRLLLLAALAFAAPALAQTVDLNLTATSQGPGLAVPTLTWSNPTAASCVGTGDWGGTKPVSGTSGVLAAVNANKSYTLSCTYAGITQAVVNWVAPTLNTDGTPLTDLAGYRIYYNTGDPSMVTAPTGRVRPITSGSTLSTVIAGLTAGTWYFTATALRASGVESGIGNIVSLVISPGATASKTVTLVFPGTVITTVR